MSDLPHDSAFGRRSLLLGAGVAAAAAAGMAAAPAVGAAPTPAPAAGPGPGAVPEGRYRVDLHAHFLPPEYRRALLERGHFTIGGYPTPEWSVEAALAFMDRWGIQAQVLSTSDPGVGFLPGPEARDMARYCNTFAAELFDSHPDRFGAFATLPMPDVPASLAEIDYALGTLGLDGVTLLSAYDGVYLGDPRFEPVMAELNRRGAFVFVHPAAIPADAKPTLPLPDFIAEFTFDTTRAASLMIASGTLQRYPNIRFQLSHAGGTLPFLAPRLGLASQTPLGDLWPDELGKPSILDVDAGVRSMFYDTALSAAPAPMRAVLEVTDRSHIVFGSDWPFSQLTFLGDGIDPAPRLSEVFTADERYEIERLNPLAQLPRLGGVLG